MKDASECHSMLPLGGVTGIKSSQISVDKSYSPFGFEPTLNGSNLLTKYQLSEAWKEVLNIFV